MIADVILAVDAAIPAAATMDVDVAMADFLLLIMEEIPAPAFSGSSVFCAAAETETIPVAATMDVMTVAGSSSFFCSAAEIMDVAATTAVKKIRRKGRGYFLCPFCRCFFAASCFFFFSSRHFRSIS